MNTVNTASTVVASNVADAGATVSASARSGRPLDPKSNMGKARAIFASYPDPAANTRAIKEQFVATLVGKDGKPISKATANTYFHMITKNNKSS